MFDICLSMFAWGLFVAAPKPPASIFQEQTLALPTTTGRRPILQVKNPPKGFFYLKDFLSPEESNGLLNYLETLHFEPIKIINRVAKRDVVHFGFTYRYGSGSIADAEPIPEFLKQLRNRAAHQVGRHGEEFDEVLINRYPPGANIGWHIDSPNFGDTVLGVSVGVSARLLFRRGYEHVMKKYSRLLDAGSLYVLSGSSRFNWEHSLHPVDGLRYSVTFRRVTGSSAKHLRKNA